jgi:hypothetical protein
MSQNDDQVFIDRLNQHPKLRNRMEALLNVVENTSGDCKKADDAEQYVIEELRKMGNDALHCWAGNTVNKVSDELREQQPKLHGNGKKNFAGIRLSGKLKS